MTRLGRVFNYQEIYSTIARHAWGSGAIEQLSLNLKETFTNIKGLSYTNLKYASQWYRFYSQSDTIRQQVVGDLQMPELFGALPKRTKVLFQRIKSADFWRWKRKMMYIGGSKFVEFLQR